MYSDYGWKVIFKSGYVNWKYLIINWLDKQSKNVYICHRTPVIYPILDLRKERIYTSLLFLAIALVGQCYGIIKRANT